MSGVPGQGGGGGGWDAEAERLALEHARRVMLGSTEGVLHFDQQHAAIKYVCDPVSGRLVAGVPVAALLAAEHVLWAPEESDDALQLLLSVEPLEEGVLTDRWAAYHGESEHVRWGLFWVDGGRHGAWVFDGEALACANPVSGEEAGLCRWLNGDRSALARVCQRYAGVVVPQPVCVGVDAWGVHVRARFGVVRVGFEEEATDGARARAMLEAMVKEAGV